MCGDACNRAYRVLTRSGADIALPISSKGGAAMSQTGVGQVIDKLLTDENLRARFALDRVATVAELCMRGAELTCDEIDLLCQTDARLWFLGALWQANGGTDTSSPLQRLAV
jgi:hypothetical protein